MNDVEIKYLVKHVTSKVLITIDKNATTKDAINLMLTKDIGCLVVTENGNPVGIITDRDALKKGGLIHGKNNKVGSYMSTPLVTIDLNAPIGEAAELMMNRDIRRLLVTENNKIVGLVTQKDLLGGCISAYRVVRLMEM